MIPEIFITSDGEPRLSTERRGLASPPRLLSSASTPVLNWQPASGRLKGINKLPATTKQKLSKFISRTFFTPFFQSAKPNVDPTTATGGPAQETTLREFGLTVPNTSHHSLHHARSAYSFVSAVSALSGESGLSVPYSAHQPPIPESMAGLTKLYSRSTYSSQKSRPVDKADNESGIAFLEEPDFPSDTFDSDCIDFVVSLPNEVVDHIFCQLDIQSLTVCCTVSRNWKQTVESNSIWRYKFNTHGQWKATSVLPENLTWKGLYKTRHLLERRWAAGEVTPKALAGHSDSVYCVHFDNEKIVTGSRDRIIKVWNSDTGSLIHTLGGDQSGQNLTHTGSVLCLCLDDKIMVSGSSDSSCIVWQLPEFKPIKQAFRHSAGVLDVCLDEHHIISCSKDSTISVWDRSDSDYGVKYQLSGHRGPINALNISNNYVFSAGGDGVVKMWDLATGTCVRDFRGHTRGLACVQVSGKMVISGGNDKTIRTWNMETGECLNVLEGHKCLVRSLHIFSNKIISGSYDQTIQIWDLTSGRLICNLAGSHGSWIFSAKADCKRIISTSFGTKPVILDFSEGLDKDYLKFIEM